MNWRIKALIQRILSIMPAGDIIYILLQKKFGRILKYSTLINKVFQAVEIIKALKAAGVEVEGKHIVEIGTGWIPIIPMVLFMFGHKRCDTFDIKWLLEDELTLRTGRSLALLLENTLLISEPGARERLRVFREADTVTELFNKTNIHYHAPADIRDTLLTDGSIDIIFSNTTLEHISPFQISELFSKVSKLLSPGGIMVHLIDCSDHFSHSDKNICNLNFLRYSKNVWRKFNSKFLYQNRLRANHYRDLIIDYNFEILLWNTRVNLKLLSGSCDLPIAKEFDNISLEDLSTTRVTVVARRA